MAPLTPMERPAYLDAATVKQGLIGYHMEKAKENRENLRTYMEYIYEDMRLCGSEITMTELWGDMMARKWEDGSLPAVWRDRAEFHDRCLEWLLSL